MTNTNPKDETMNEVTQVQTIAEKEFDAGLGYPDPVVFVWAATIAIDRGIKKASVQKQIKAINRQREKFGRMPVYVPIGHPAF